LATNKREKDEQEKATLQQFKSELKSKKPGRMYVLFGEEEYLKAFYLEQLKSILLDGPAADFNFHRFTQENFNMNDLESAVNSFPMMAEHSFIQIDDYEMFKDTEENRNKLVEILSDIPDYCCIVFYCNTIDFNPDKRQKKLWQAMCAAGLQVAFRKQTEQDLCVWVGRHFKSQGKRIEDKNCRYLVFVTGGLMSALASEIEKICAYTEHEVVTRQDIDDVVEPVLDAVVFAITDAIGEGRFGIAIGLLQNVMKKQEDPVAILGAISAHFRRIRMAKVLLANGKHVQALCEMAGIAPYPAQKIFDAAARVSISFANKAVLFCEETDSKMKNSVDDQQALLELLLLKLAEEYRHD